MKSWFQVMWPLSGRSLVLCDLIQPYSFTSLLQEVFLLVKRRALRHQHVSRENALSWPNQPCLAGSSFPSWKSRLCLTASWRWLVLAESPDSSQLGREAWLLSPQRCISHQNAHATWRRGLCCGVFAVFWGRRRLRWDSAGSAGVHVPVRRVKRSRPSVPARRAVLLLLCRNAAFSSEKHLAWVLWRASVGLCRELPALSSPHQPPLKVWANRTPFSCL